jgi:hypothetical protein
MTKQLRPSELAEIVTGLLVRPDLMGELEGSSHAHEEFIEVIGCVVADFCGGKINCVSPFDLPRDQTPGFTHTPYLGVVPNDSLPSLGGCVWAPYDPHGWDDHTSFEFGLSETAAHSPADVKRLRERLQGLLIEAVSALETEQDRTELACENTPGGTTVTVADTDIELSRF